MSSTTLPTDVPCIVLNVQAGTALDLFKKDDPYADRAAVGGYPLHIHQNQQWTFRHGKVGYVIENIMTHTQIGYHPDDEATLSEGSSASCNRNPVEYNIQGDAETGFSFVLSNQDLPFALELEDGSAEPGKIILFNKPDSSLKQKWMVLPVQNYGDKKFKPIYKPTILKVDSRKRIRVPQGPFSMDCGSADGSLHMCSTNSGIANQKWTIEPAIIGYLLKGQNGKYVRAKQDGLKMEAEGTQFLFEPVSKGKEKDGYYIVDAADPNLAFDLEKEPVGDAVKVVLKPGRHQRWIVQTF